MRPENSTNESVVKLSLLETLLRSPVNILETAKNREAPDIVPRLLAIALGGAACYGVIVGSFAGGTQWWAAPVKLSTGLLLSTLMCLPSFYVFACMSGIRASLREILALLLSALALAGVLLVAILPVSWIFTQASDSIGFMGGLHVSVWVVSLFAFCALLGNGLRHLQSESMTLMRIWVLVFTFVTLQMTTTLRPIIGTSEHFLPQSKKFFLTHWGDSLNKNAAVEYERKGPSSPPLRSFPR